MIKMTILLRRKAGVSHDEFVSCHRNKHAPLFSWVAATLLSECVLARWWYGHRSSSPRDFRRSSIVNVTERVFPHAGSRQSSQ